MKSPIFDKGGRNYFWLMINNLYVYIYIYIHINPVNGFQKKNQNMKRAKKISGFLSQEEAGEYVDELEALVPKLTVGLWAYIFSLNEGLSVYDILLMNKARPESFAKFVNTGQIFRQIANRQFGSELTDQAFEWLEYFPLRSSSQKKHSMATLISLRLIKRIENTSTNTLTIGDKGNIELTIDYERRGRLLGTTQNDDSKTVTATHGEPELNIQIYLEGMNVRRNMSLVDDFTTVVGKTPAEYYDSSWRPEGKRADRTIGVHYWELNNVLGSLRNTLLYIFYVSTKNNIFSTGRTELIETKICAACRHNSPSFVSVCCGKVYYCDKKCATFDWSQHNALCEGKK